MLLRFLFRFTGLLLLVPVFNACTNASSSAPVTALEIQTVFTCDCSIRAMEVTEEELFFAASDGIYGYLNPQNHRLKLLDTLVENQEKPMFRALARTRSQDFILAVDNPALIYKVALDSAPQLVFKQNIVGTFYDAMAFWNEQEGLILGDPLEDCLSITLTRDAGKTWTPIPCEKLPKTQDGEAAFAASNSNIALKGDHTWLLSGGTTTRVFYSPDKGENWQVYPTPLLNGKSTTGGYSLDFYDEKTGIIVGGDYTEPQLNRANIARTRDGGKNWELIADQQNAGYKSSVAFVPHQKAKELLAVGTTGIDYSKDSGDSWQKLSSEEFHVLRFLNDSTGYVGGEGKIARIKLIRE